MFKGGDRVGWGESVTAKGYGLAFWGYVLKLIGTDVQLHEYTLKITELYTLNTGTVDPWTGG